MNILVTGCAGFIGFHVSKALLSRGDNVIGLDILDDYYDVNLKKARVELCSGMTFLKEDVADFTNLLSIVEKYKIEKICHFAALAGVRKATESAFSYEDVNAKGMLSVLEVCRKKNIPLVYGSSSAVYGSQTDVPFREDAKIDDLNTIYAATKRYNELLAQVYFKQYGVRSLGVRLFTVYGPYGRPDMVMSIFASKIISGEPITVYANGDVYRDYTFADDAVAGILLALDSQIDCEIINICKGEKVKITDVIDLISADVGKSAIVEKKQANRGEVLTTFGDNMKARRLLGFDPKVNIGNGISEFMKWYRAYYLWSN